MATCGYQYYKQSVIDANPQSKKVDTFIRFLLCNQKSIQALTQAFFEAGWQQKTQGKNYCYMYFNILQFLPDPCKKCTYCDTQSNQQVYFATTLYIFWITSQKMAKDPAFTQDLITNRKLVYFDSYTKTYKEMILTDLDIQVLLIYMMGENIQNLYRQANNVFWYLEQGRDFCYMANFPYDLSGCPLGSIRYGAREFRELVFTYSDQFANITSPMGKKCLLNKCALPVNN